MKVWSLVEPGRDCDGIIVFVMASVPFTSRQAPVPMNRGRMRHLIDWKRSDWWVIIYDTLPSQVHMSHAPLCGLTR